MVKEAHLPDAIHLRELLLMLPAVPFQLSQVCALRYELNGSLVLGMLIPQINLLVELKCRHPVTTYCVRTRRKLISPMHLNSKPLISDWLCHSDVLDSQV
jgi:hypothetical protein